MDLIGAWLSLYIYIYRGLFHYKPHSHTNLKTTISTPIFAMSTPIFLFFIFFFNFRGGPLLTSSATSAPTDVALPHQLPRQHWVSPLLTWQMTWQCHVSRCWRGRWRGTATSAVGVTQCWRGSATSAVGDPLRWRGVVTWRGGKCKFGEVDGKARGVILLVFKSLGGYLFSFEIGF